MAVFKLLALSVAAVVSVSFATPPPGHVKKPDTDEHPPKYEYGYEIQDDKGGRQGHQEARDGEYARGAYYVDLPDGNTQQVQYYADDWGYHPLVSYSSTNQYGHIRAQFALGEKAVAALNKGVAPGTESLGALGPAGLKELKASNPSAESPGIQASPQAVQPATIIGVQPSASSIQALNGGSASGPSSGIGVTGPAGSPYQKTIGSSSSLSSLPQSSNLITGQGGSIVYAPSASSSGKQNDKSAANQISYSTFITHTGDDTRTDKGATLTADAAYNGVKSQSGGDSGYETKYEKTGSASAYGQRTGSTVAPALSNLVVQQPQGTFQTSFGSSAPSSVYNQASVSASTTVAPILVQQSQEIYQENYVKSGSSNEHSQATGSVSPVVTTFVVHQQGHENVGSSSNSNNAGSFVSSTASPLFIQEPQTIAQGSYRATSSLNAHNEDTGYVSSTISPVVTPNSQVSYQENYGESEFQTSYNEASKVISSTVSPLLIQIQKHQEQKQNSYVGTFGASGSSNVHSETSGTVSPTVTNLIIQQPHESYQENYGTTGSSNAQSQVAGSASPVLSNLFVQHSQGSYQDNYEASGSSNTHSQTVGSASPTLSTFTVQQPQVSHQQSHGVTGSSNSHNQDSGSISPAISHQVAQPQVSYQTGYGTTGGSGLQNQVSVSLSYVGQQPQVPYQESYGNSQSSNLHNQNSEITVSSTPSPLVSHQPNVVYQESYGTYGASNNINGAANSYVAPTASNVVPQQPSVVYQENYRASEASEYYKQASSSHANPTVTTLLYHQPQVQFPSSNTGYNGINSAPGSTASGDSSVYSGTSAVGNADYSGLNDNGNIQITSYVADTNAAIEFGAKVNKGYRAQIANADTPIRVTGLGQNEYTQYNEIQSHADNYAPSITPTPLTHSSSRPIVVAEFHNNGGLSVATSTPSSVILSESSTQHVPVYLSSAPGSTSYQSSAGGSQLSSHALLSSANVQAEQNSNTLLRPIVVAPQLNYPSGPAENYIVSSTPEPSSNTVIITPRPEPLPVPASLISSSENLAQISATLPRVSPGFRRQFKNKYPQRTNTEVSTTPEPSHVQLLPSPGSPPAVNEKIVGDAPPPTTVVEVQKSVPLELNFGNVGIQQLQISNLPQVSNYIPIENNQQILGDVNQSPVNYNEVNEAQIGGTQLLLETLLEEHRGKDQTESQIQIGNTHSLLQSLQLANSNAQVEAEMKAQTLSQEDEQAQKENHEAIDQAVSQQQKSLLQALEEEQRNAKQALIEQQSLLQAQSEEERINQQQIQIANTQSLLQALQFENSRAKSEAESQAQALTQADGVALKKALESALSHLESVKQEAQIQVHDINQEEISSEGLAQAQTSVKPQVEYRERKKPKLTHSKLNSQTEESFQNLNQGTSSNNETPLILEVAGTSQTKYNLETGTEVKIGQKQVSKSQRKPHIQTLLNSEVHISSENSNSEISPQVQIIGAEAQKQIQIDSGYEQQISEAQKQIRSGYNQYFADLNKQLGYNQQVYGSIRQHQTSFNQLPNLNTQIPVGLIQQLLDSEKQQDSGLSQHISESEIQEQSLQTDQAVHNTQENTKLIEVDKPVPVVETKYVEVERPVIVHRPVHIEHTKYVKVEKPVPVAQPVPVEVTKLVQVDRPVPYPTPVAVPHPIPVPYAVPHAIEVPVHHLVAVPQYVKVPVKEYHPVFFHGKPFAPKPSQPTLTYNFPQKGNLHRNIMKHSLYGIGRYASSSSRRPYHNIHTSIQSHPFRLGPIQKQGRGRLPPPSRHHGNLRRLCIEYGGFRPPLVPSKQIEEDPASTQEAEKKSD